MLVTPESQRDPGLTLRALGCGLALLPLNVVWITVIEVRWYSLDGCELPLFVIPVFLLFVLVLVNRLLARRGWALSQGELLSVYLMQVMSATVAGHDFQQNLFGAISHPYRFATPENNWAQRFFDYLPRWSGVRNPALLKDFYEGNSELTAAVWQAWAIPLLAWGSLLVVAVGMMLCLNVLLRRQWTEHERLTYPIVQLPLALTEERGSQLLGQPAFWSGFALAFALGLAAGLHHLIPAVPALNVKQTDLHRYLVGQPWSWVGKAAISWYPFMIGLAWFLPLDLGFSCWFFYVVRMAMQIAGGYLGGETGRFFPRLPEQGAGGWLALAGIALWGSRHHLKRVWREALAGGGKEEPIPYGLAILGLVAGFSYLLWFTALFDVRLGVAVFFWLLFFLFAVAITRVRAELGAPHEIYFVNPRRVMMMFAGTSGFLPPELTWFCVSYWFNRGYRSHPMPAQLEAFKMAEGDRLQPRRLVLLMMLAVVLGLMVSSWSQLAIGHSVGVTQCKGFKLWVGTESYTDLSSWLETPVPPDFRGTLWLLGAGAFTVLCNGMRRRFLWWPFHPAGYPLAVSFAMDYFWFAVFVSWAAKWTVLRLGGMKLYRAGIPFALGLILGDYTIGSVWALVGPLWGIETYKIFI